MQICTHFFNRKRLYLTSINYLGGISGVFAAFMADCIFNIVSSEGELSPPSTRWIVEGFTPANSAAFRTLMPLLRRSSRKASPVSIFMVFVFIADANLAIFYVFCHPTAAKFFIFESFGKAGYLFEAKNLVSVHTQLHTDARISPVVLL